MAIKLNKGGSYNLTKEEPALKKIMIGLGWDSGKGLDLDASVFLLGQNLKLPAEGFFVFYNNLRSPDGAVQHTGDNRTGVGDGDDEMILLNLDLVDNHVHEILIVASIYDAEIRNHNFGLLKDAYIRLYDVENKREILQYDLDALYPDATIVEFGKIHRIGTEWKFTAMGLGSEKGLQGLVDIYA